jgi:RNA polymerase sigma-70 factor (ECF subfamily)
MVASRVELRRGWTDEQVLSLVREHESLVCSYLKSLGCPADQVDDLAQETFLRMFSRPAVDRGAAGLRGTLCVVARNLFFNTLRADAARPDLEQIDRAWVEFEGCDAGSAYLDALRGCLERLPGRTREVLRLRFGSNTPRAEIASRMELSLGGVKSILLRTKEDLRACIERKLGMDPADSLEAAQ